VFVGKAQATFRRAGCLVCCKIKKAKALEKAAAAYEQKRENDGTSSKIDELC
jgi:hypothetical protein